MKTYLIAIVSVLVLLPALAAAVTESPEAAAQRYETALGFKVQGVSCTQVDTDNDGYVTCTVALAGYDKPSVQSIQCAATRAVDADGCETQARHTEGCKPTVVYGVAQ